MNAVIYARYSSERQTEQSIEGQLRVCREYAEEQGITIIGEYIDRAISGTTDKRPDFQRMISDSSSRTFQAVIVYKLDRFARDRYASALYKSKLKKNGVRVLSAQEHITDAPEGIILEGLLEAMNEYYSAELSQKIKRGMRESILKGKTTGGNVALGYRIGPDKRLEIDEKGAAIVRRIFDAYNSGKTFAEICADLNAAGLSTSRGKAYRGSTITRILSNKRYVGEYTAAGMEEAIPCPAIVEREVFEAVQNKLQQSKAKHRHHAESHDYLLTGKLRCGICGRACTGSAGTSKTGKRHYYYRCGKGCFASLRAEETEEKVVRAVSEYLTDEVCDIVAEKAYQMYQESKEDNTEAAALTAERADVEKKISNAVNAILNGISSDSLKATLQQLEEKKKSLDIEIQRLETKCPELKQEHFRYFMKNFSKVKKENADNRSIIDTMVSSVVVSKEELTIVINITKNAEPLTLHEINAAKSESSCNVIGGGGIETLHEHVKIVMLSPNAYAIVI